MDVRKMETTEPDAEDGQHWRQYIYIAIFICSLKLSIGHVIRTR